jgi:hypothetical protein
LIDWKQTVAFVCNDAIQISLLKLRSTDAVPIMVTSSLIASAENAGNTALSGPVAIWTITSVADAVGLVSTQRLKTGSSQSNAEGSSQKMDFMMSSIIFCSRLL